MKNITLKNQVSFSTLFAIFCFVIGTMLFFTYKVIPNEGLLVAGFIYVIAAVFFNLIILVGLVYEFVTIPWERTENAIRILIVLSNIPIAFMYYNLIVN